MLSAVWIDTVNAIKPYWLARTIGGTAMDVGLALFVLTIVMSFVLGKDAAMHPRPVSTPR